jgi:Uncharacterized protein conserved in cyanobacteria
MTHPTVTTPAPPPADDPFRYGWRYVRRPTPNDPDHLEPVPLTLEDVLHPEEGDFIVHSDRHETDRMYLTAVLRARLEAHGRAIVLSDVRVAWDVPDLRPHGPDVMVIPGLRERRDWSTFDVAEEGVRPALMIEITSPETRENDVVWKVAHYARAGVAQYVIVDNIGRRGERKLRFLDYRLVGDTYRLQPPDERGWVYLELAALWVGVEGDHVVCYADDGTAFGDYATVVQQAAEAEARARQEAGSAGGGRSASATRSGSAGGGGSTSATGSGSAGGGGSTSATGSGSAGGGGSTSATGSGSAGGGGSAGTCSSGTGAAGSGRTGRGRSTGSAGSSRTGRGGSAGASGSRTSATGSSRTSGACSPSA